MNERTYERKAESYIPLGIIAGGIIMSVANITIIFQNVAFTKILPFFLALQKLITCLQQ